MSQDPAVGAPMEASSQILTLPKVTEGRKAELVEEVANIRTLSDQYLYKVEHTGPGTHYRPAQRPNLLMHSSLLVLLTYTSSI